MIKLFPEKKVNRVFIHTLRDSKLEKTLLRAKGMMNNYLKDKFYTVRIVPSIKGDEFVSVVGRADSKKAIRTIAIKKNGDTPILRRIYQALEEFTEDFVINTKK